MGSLEGKGEPGRQSLAHRCVPGGQPVLVVAHPPRQLAGGEGLGAEHRPPGGGEPLPFLLTAVGLLAELPHVAQEAVDAGVSDDATDDL
jgi:hypothetical protein